MSKVRPGLNEMYEAFQRDLPGVSATGAPAPAASAPAAPTGPADANDHTDGATDFFHFANAASGTASPSGSLRGSCATSPVGFATPAPLVFTHVHQHVPMPHAPAQMVSAREDAVLDVAGMRIAYALPVQPQRLYTVGGSKPDRKRGRDRKAEGEKRVRKCAVCKQINCAGKWKRSECENV